MVTQPLRDELDPKTRLLVIQYGCYADAAERFQRGGGETYFAQRYTVDFLADVARHVARVTVLSYGTSYPRRRLHNGVYVVGSELYPPGRGVQARLAHFALLRVAQRERPTHIAVACPEPTVLAWALMQRARTFAVFADSFTRASRGARLKYRALAGLLNRPGVAWVSNHNLAASLDLARIGVRPEKVVPFDWPPTIRAADNPPKTLRREGPFRVVYVGMMLESKGVGDAIRAVDMLRRGGREVELSLVGGTSPTLVAEVARLGLDAHVHFLGKRPHAHIVPLMSEHDAVLVPTRHEYPEGLPMTIYEGLCSRSPVVFSDHPMFAWRMRDGVTGVRFQAGSADALARAVERLMDDPVLYAALSASAEDTTRDYLCPVKWDQLYRALLSTRRATRESIAPYALARGHYGDLPLAG
ncbi:MAG: glycosyltransferase family 4 protein [Polyangiales bacterium]|nr:glycosyltransferase family 4 protein [Sandaracinaceae bacterium]